jgi:hypothetical protein
MRAKCRHVTVLDFTQGLGHLERLEIDDRGIVTEEGIYKDEWAVAADAFDREGMGIAAKE